MTLKILTSHIIKDLYNYNLVKYFKPIDLTINNMRCKNTQPNNYMYLNEFKYNLLKRQLTYSKSRQYNNINYKFDEYYICNVNNINIFKILCKVEDTNSKNKYNEEIYYTNNNNNNNNNKLNNIIILYKTLLLNNKNIEYNEVDINLINKLDYIQFINKEYSDILYYNKLAAAKLLHISSINNIIEYYSTVMIKICNELTKNNNEYISTLADDIIISLSNTKLLDLYKLKDRLNELISTIDDTFVKKQLYILIKILEFIKI